MAKKTRVENIALNASAGLMAKGVSILCNFIMRTVFIHTLGIAYTGVSSLFTDVLTMLSFAELGISSAITYALYKPVADDDPERVAMLMNFYKTAYRVVALVVFVGGMCVLPFLGVIVPIDKIDSSNPEIQMQIYEQLRLIYILYVVNSSVSYLLIYKSSLLTATQNHRYASYVQIGFSGVRLIVECIILFGFNWTKYCFIIYLVANIILTRSQNFVISRIATKRYPSLSEYKDAKLPKEERSKLFKNIGALLIYKVASSVNSGIDSIIISSMFGTMWVGYVSNYRMVTNNVNKLLNQFYNSATPSVGNMATLSDSEKQYRSFRSMFFLAFWSVCFCVTSFIVLLSPFVGIWLGAKYVKSMWIVLILVASAYCSMIIHPISTFRTSNGLFVQGKLRPLMMLIINVILSFLLARWLGTSYGPEWGIFGVKLATVISSLLTIQWFDPWIVYKYVFHRPVKEYLVLFVKYTFLTALCAAITYFAGMLVPLTLNKYIRFIILCGLCVVIPNGILYFLFRNTKEYEAVKTILGKLSGKVLKKFKISKSAAQ